jgi:hypothetical protein
MISVSNRLVQCQGQSCEGGHWLEQDFSSADIERRLPSKRAGICIRSPRKSSVYWFMDFVVLSLTWPSDREASPRHSRSGIHHKVTTEVHEKWAHMQRLENGRLVDLSKDFDLLHTEIMVV